MKLSCRLVYASILPSSAATVTRWQKKRFYVKGIVHFEINFWYVLAYLNGNQDVGVFVSTVFSILIFFGQTVVVCQSYNAGLGGPRVHHKEHAQKSPN